MKKILLLLPFVLPVVVAKAQTNALKVDAFQPIWNTLAISFEHKLTDRSSFQLSASRTFKFRDQLLSLSSSPTTSGFGITPEYRFYVSKKHTALNGLYIAPYARYQYLSKRGHGYTSEYGYQSADYQAKLNAFGMGAIVGRQWIVKRWFLLDIYAGPGYASTNTSSDQPNYVPNRGDFMGYFDDTSVDFRFGFALGVAF